MQDKQITPYDIHTYSATNIKKHPKPEIGFQSKYTLMNAMVHLSNE